MQTTNQLDNPLPHKVVVMISNGKGSPTIWNGTSSKLWST